MVADMRPEMSPELLQLARWVARGYFITGGDEEDLIQEAQVGAFKAVRDFDPSQGSSFRSFAKLVIERQVITAVKTANRDKHRPLSESARVTVNPEGEVESILESIADPAGSPLEVVIAREATYLLFRKIRMLSPLERACLLRFANGDSYAEMADLGNEKTVDNALQRARLFLNGEREDKRRAYVSRPVGERKIFTAKKGDVPRAKAA